MQSMQGRRTCDKLQRVLNADAGVEHSFAAYRGRDTLKFDRDLSIDSPAQRTPLAQLNVLERVTVTY